MLHGSKSPTRQDPSNISETLSRIVPKEFQNSYVTEVISNLAIPNGAPLIECPPRVQPIFLILCSPHRHLLRPLSRFVPKECQEFAEVYPYPSQPIGQSRDRKKLPRDVQPIYHIMCPQRARLSFQKKSGAGLHLKGGLLHKSWTE